MLVIPAIDLKDGQVVRLYKGDYSKNKIYSTSPENKAKEFEKLGVKYIHIVDLDGAKTGKSINIEAIKRIRKSTNIPIQVGGGIRNKETVKLYLEDISLNRIILGTSALNNSGFLKEMLKEYGNEKIIVSVDVKKEKVSVSGWQETSDIEYISFIKKLEKIGVKYIVATDISKDGTLEGPNFKMYKKIIENSNIQVIVSGGVKDMQDIEKVSKLNCYGCIVGKAYYEGKINLKELNGGEF